MEKCRVCGLIVSGSQYDSYKNELGQVLPEIAFTTCDYCLHHEIDKGVTYGRHKRDSKGGTGQPKS